MLTSCVRFASFFFAPASAASRARRCLRRLSSSALARPFRARARGPAWEAIEREAILLRQKVYSVADGLDHRTFVPDVAHLARASVELRPASLKMVENKGLLWRP